VGSPEGDGVKHLWTLWWMRAEALGGTPGLLTTLVDYPVGMQIYPIEPLDGLLSLLVPLPPVPLSNVLALAHLVMLGLAAGWLGKLVSGRDRGALVAGALAQGSAFTAFTLHVGVGELRQVWWIPLGLAFLVKARETRNFRWFLALAGALAGATLSCFYHGFFLATAVSLYALATLRPNPRLLLGYVLAAGLSLLIVLPVIRTFSASYAPRETHDAATFSEWMHARYELDALQSAALDPVELFVPRAHLAADRQTLAYTGGRYLGWLTLALAVAGVAAAPKKALPWCGVAVGGIVLALGPVLWWNGHLVMLGGARITLPLATINRALGWFAEPMNFPARFVSVSMIALAVLASLATRWRGVVWLVPLAVAETTLGDLVPWPRATITLPDMSGLGTPALPAGAVADLTPFTRGPVPTGNGLGQSPLSLVDPEGRGRAMAAQILLDRPFATVPIERIDHWGPEGLYWLAALPLSGALAGGQVADEDLRASAWLLADAGFGAVMLTHHCGSLQPSAATQVLDRWFGPRQHAACATAWPVPARTGATPDPEPDAARWKADQERRAAALAPPQMGPQFAPAPR
jgi:hypothetical protein